MRGRGHDTDRHGGDTNRMCADKDLRPVGSGEHLKGGDMSAHTRVISLPCKQRQGSGGKGGIILPPYIAHRNAEVESDVEAVEALTEPEAARILGDPCDCLVAIASSAAGTMNVGR